MTRRDASSTTPSAASTPGAPEYRAAVEAEEGARWRTEAHVTLLEYHDDREDIVLVSELLAD